MEVEDNLLLTGAAVSKTELNLLWLLRNLVKGLGAAALSCNLLFVMISGALLLPFREETPGTFYRKRLSKVLIPLVCYYLFYLMNSNGISFHLGSIWNACKTMISGPNGFVPHFWMAYLLLGLYIAVPFQRWMLKNLPDSIARGMAAAVFCGSVFRVSLYLIGCEMPFSSILFSWEGIFYFGYFLTLPCSRKYDQWLLVGGGFSALVIACLFCRWENAAAIAANYSPFTILSASAIFILFRKWEEKKAEKTIFPVLSALIQVGNKYSFSILLIHWFVLYILVDDKLGIKALMFGNYWVFIGVLAQLLTALLISFVFSFIYDQTVVFVAQKLWDYCLRCGIRE